MQWTNYTLSWTATISQPSVVFGFTTDNSRNLYLDSVRVFNNKAPNTLLLLNGDFETSSTAPDYWYDWCGSPCGTQQGRITSGNACMGGSGNCYQSNCGRANIVEFLSQGFSATIGDTYTIIFALKTNGGAGGSGPSLSVSIY